MTKRIRYDGPVAIFVTTIIPNSNERWRPGQSQEVSDTDAALLLAAGQGFTDITVAPGSPSQIQPVTIEGLATTIDAATYAKRAELRRALRTPVFAGSVATPADLTTLANFVANPTTVLAGTTLWVASTSSLWLLLDNPSPQDPAPFATLANWHNLGVSAVVAAPPITVETGATLTRAAHFNRAVICPGGALTVNTAGSVVPDYLHFWNSSTVTPLVITIAGLTITVAPNDTALAENTGGADNAGWRDAGADASTLSGVTYHPTTGKMTGYTLGSVVYTVTYPNATTVVHSGGGRTLTITLDATSGKVIGKVPAQVVA